MDWLRTALWNSIGFGTPKAYCVMCEVIFDEPQPDQPIGYFQQFDIPELDAETAERSASDYALAQTNQPCHIASSEVTPLWFEVDGPAEAGGRIFFGDED